MLTMPWSAVQWPARATVYYLFRLLDHITHRTQVTRSLSLGCACAASRPRAARLRKHKQITHHRLSLSSHARLRVLPSAPLAYTQTNRITQYTERPRLRLGLSQRPGHHTHSLARARSDRFHGRFTHGIPRTYGRALFQTDPGAAHSRGPAPPTRPTRQDRLRQDRPNIFRSHRCISQSSD